jgi:tetratricopeptide (TPR) repeat protein
MRLLISRARPYLRSLSRLSCLVIATSFTGVARAQSPIVCGGRPAASQAVERGWTAYRKGDISSAETEFKRALALCPNDAGALTGAGYAAMRQGRLAEARTFFRRAVAADSTSYDAVAGAGMAAYRDGDPASARRSFERALRIVPRDSTALSYLAKLPAPIVDAGPSTYVRSTTTAIVARTGKRIFEVRDAAGRWSPLWIKAVNLGAALPGKFPSEFPPNDSTYERWIALIAGMGGNAVRLYTIHPPHFYAALRSWNLAHPAHPIWLIHGVWAELPPGKKQEKYDDPKWLGQFHGEMRHVVSLLHGDAAIPVSPGHASGVYRADVSQWTIGYIIGREWEPYSVVAYNSLRPIRTSYGGTYVTLPSGNPLEAWLAEQCDYLVSFEMQQYNA